MFAFGFGLLQFPLLAIAAKAGMAEPSLFVVWLAVVALAAGAAYGAL